MPRGAAGSRYPWHGISSTVVQDDTYSAGAAEPTVPAGRAPSAHKVFKIQPGGVPVAEGISSGGRVLPTTTYCQDAYHPHPGPTSTTGTYAAAEATS